MPRDEKMTTGGPMNAGNELQERALAGPITADQADRFSMLDLERNVFESPESLDRLPLARMNQTEETDLEFDSGIVTQPKLLRNAPCADDGHQSCSVKRFSLARNRIEPNTKAPAACIEAMTQIVASGQTR